jgi:hypothetical protein
MPQFYGLAEPEYVDEMRRILLLTYLLGSSACQLALRNKRATVQ